MSSSRWFQTAHGRVLLLGAGWLALLLIVFAALRLGGGGDGDWKLLGYLALWTYASPLVGVAGSAIAVVAKVAEGADRRMRAIGIIVHVLIFLLGVALIWNASRG